MNQISKKRKKKKRKKKIIKNKNSIRQGQEKRRLP